MKLLQSTKLRLEYCCVFIFFTDSPTSVLIVIESSVLRAVYGCPLEDHLRVHEREIAFVIEECITFLHEFAMDVQVSKYCREDNRKSFMEDIGIISLN